jgi:hypothetical protein
VEWSHFQVRKGALEAAVTLGAAARALVEPVKRAWPRKLPALRARLYRRRHSGKAPAVSAAQ